MLVADLVQDVGLLILVIAIFIIACATVFQVARDMQHGLERDERHALKNQIAAYRALLLAHGILPDDEEGG